MSAPTSRGHARASRSRSASPCCCGGSGRSTAPTTCSRSAWSRSATLAWAVALLLRPPDLPDHPRRSRRDRRAHAPPASAPAPSSSRSAPSCSGSRRPEALARDEHAPARPHAPTDRPSPTSVIERDDVGSPAAGDRAPTVDVERPRPPASGSPPSKHDRVRRRPSPGPVASGSRSTDRGARGRLVGHVDRCGTRSLGGVADQSDAPGFVSIPLTDVISPSAPGSLAQPADERHQSPAAPSCSAARRRRSCRPARSAARRAGARARAPAPAPRPGSSCRARRRRAPIASGPVSPSASATASNAGHRWISARRGSGTIWFDSAAGVGEHPAVARDAERGRRSPAAMSTSAAAWSTFHCEHSSFVYGVAIIRLSGARRRDLVGVEPAPVPRVRVRRPRPRRSGPRARPTWPRCSTGVRPSACAMRALDQRVLVRRRPRARARSRSR